MIFLLYIIISYVLRPKANPSPMIENNRALAVILDNRKYLLALFSLFFSFTSHQSARKTLLLPYFSDGFFFFFSRMYTFYKLFFRDLTNLIS